MSTKHFVDELQVGWRVYYAVDGITGGEVNIIDKIEGKYETWYVCEDVDGNYLIRMKDDLRDCYHY